MPITYDAPSNTITVTGYTEATPCTLLDIYNADVAGAWGVVSRLCTDGYCFDCHLTIGDGSTETWFSVDEEAFYFTIGHYQFITLLNSHTIIRDTWFRNEWSSYIAPYFGCAFTGELKIYDSSFLIPLQATAFGYDGSGFNALSLTISNSNFQKNRSFFFYYTTTIVELTKMDIYEQYTALAVNIEGTISYLTTRADNTEGIYYNKNGGILTLIDCKIYASSKTLYLRNNATIKCIDCVYDPAKLYCDTAPTCYVYDQHYVNVHVRDSSGNLSGATVTMEDKDGNVVFSVSTGADGKIAQQTVTRILYTLAAGGFTKTTTNYYPFTITISKAGYETYSLITDLDETADEHVMLKRAQPINFLDGEPILKLCPESALGDRIFYRRLL